MPTELTADSHCVVKFVSQFALPSPCWHLEDLNAVQKWHSLQKTEPEGYSYSSLLLSGKMWAALLMCVGEVSCVCVYLCESVPRFCFVCHTTVSPLGWAKTKADGLLSTVERLTRWAWVAGDGARDKSPQVCDNDRALPFVCSPSRAAYTQTHTDTDISDNDWWVIFVTEQTTDICVLNTICLRSYSYCLRPYPVFKVFKHKTFFCWCFHLKWTCNLLPNFQLMHPVMT